MSGELSVLLSAAALLGVVHTLLGPDHYLPFITLARARSWSRRKTLAITVASGLGHVAGSLALGGLALALGWALVGVDRLEALRAEIAGWLLLGFGLAYLIWGLRRALRTKPHTHRHVHADGTVHDHLHSHLGAHAHHHASSRFGGAVGWSLFALLVVGPCEPLIPVLMYPAATGSPLGVALVVAIFGSTTIATMAGVVLVGHAGLARLPSGAWERWAHAVAGLVVAACGVAVQLGL